MTLAEYVDRIMKERGLSAYEVEKRSGNQIADSYVVRIRQGKSKRPSVPKLKGLAKGLGVDYNELLEVAGGSQPAKGWTAESLIHAVSKIMKSDLLTEAVQLLLNKSEQELKAVIAYLKRKK